MKITQRKLKLKSQQKQTKRELEYTQIHTLFQRRLDDPHILVD